jgi:hypothetical protein
MEIAALAADPRVATALEHIEEADQRTIAHMVDITRIPAPSGAEQLRAEWLCAAFRAEGLIVEAPDEAGNVRAVLRGAQPPIILAAHIDTVFPLGTPLTVTHDGSRIYAPGISDNARGVAALIRVGPRFRLLASGLRAQFISSAPSVRREKVTCEASNISFHATSQQPHLWRSMARGSSASCTGPWDPAGCASQCAARVVTRGSIAARHIPCMHSQQQSWLLLPQRRIPAPPSVSAASRAVPASM